MKNKLIVLTAGLALQFGAGLANADSHKAVVKVNVDTKQCYLFNPRNIDQQWTVPCEPKPAQPTKMCRINSAFGFDAALFTAPCEPQTVPPMKMCRINNIAGFDAAQFTEPCENVEKRKN